MKKKKKKIDSLHAPAKQLVDFFPIVLKRNNDFGKCVKFGAISRKCDILSITAWLEFESEIPFAYAVCGTYNCDYLPHTTFRLYFYQFTVKYRFTFPILRSLP